MLQMWLNVVLTKGTNVTDRGFSGCETGLRAVLSESRPVERQLIMQVFSHNRFWPGTPIQEANDVY